MGVDRSWDSIGPSESWDTAENPPEDAVVLAHSDIVSFDDVQIDLLYLEPVVPAEEIRYPGLSELPAQGEYAATPAARQMVQEQGLSQVFPITMEIAPEGVASANERLLVTTSHLSTQGSGFTRPPVVLKGFGAGNPRKPYIAPDVPIQAPVSGVVLLVFLPAIALLGVAARLSAQLRADRIQLIAKLGARGKGRVIAAFEAALLALPGIITASLLWIVLIPRLDTLPLINVPFFSYAWQWSPLHLALCLGALGVIMASTAALARPRSGVAQYGGEEKLSPLRVLPFAIGLVGLLAAPWGSTPETAYTMFMVMFTITAIGVPIALPLWFKNTGLALRGQQRSTSLWLVGAKLARFPRSWGRGWSLLALTCALTGPVVVYMSVVAEGDTDMVFSPVAQGTPTVFEAHVSQPESLDQAAPGEGNTFIAYTLSDEDETLVAYADCEEAAMDVGFETCSAFTQSLGQLSTGLQEMEFVGGPAEAGTQAVFAIGLDRESLLADVATLDAGNPPILLDEIYPVQLHESPLVPWIIAGIGSAVITTLLAVFLLIVDRSMIANQATSLDRMGLPLRRRQKLDAVTFVVSCLTASAGGITLSVFAAIVFARGVMNDGSFPYNAIALTLAGVAITTLIGGIAVALGTHHTTLTTHTHFQPTSQ